MQVSPMVDEKKFKQTLVSFRGFRSHVFGSITEAMVRRVPLNSPVCSKRHRATISVPLYPSSMMLRRAITQVRYARSSVRSSDLETQYTSVKYCDKKFFNDRAARLSEHFAQLPRADAAWDAMEPKVVNTSGRRDQSRGSSV